MRRTVAANGGGISLGALALAVAVVATAATTFGLLAFAWTLDAPPAVHSVSAVLPNPAADNDVELRAGSGISVVPLPGEHAVRVDNAGVTSLEAGSGIALSGATGHVVVAALPQSQGVPLEAGPGIFVELGENATTVSAKPLFGGAGISVIDAGGDNCTVVNTGVLSATAGTGIAVAPGATGDVTISNTGVLSATAGTGITVPPGATGDVTIGNAGVTSIAAGARISLVGGPTGDVTVSADAPPTVEAGTGISVDAGPANYTVHNTGVLSATAGDGIVISGGPTGHITINATAMGGGVTSVDGLGGGGMTVSPTTGAVLVGYLLAVQTTADESDPNGPQVAFLNQYGVSFSAVGNTWYTSDQVAYTTMFFPGVAPGDDGIGRSGNEWRVPAVGFYSFSADCVFTITTLSDGSTIVPEIAFNVGAGGNDPTMSGFIPYGGRAADQADQWTGDVRTVPMSATAMAHLACTGCAGAINHPLLLHARISGSVTSWSATCRILASRVL